MRRFAKPRSVAVAVCLTLVSAAGCGREQATAPAVGKAARERSKFFTKLAAEPNAGALKAHFQPKFPDLDLHVGRAGPATIRPATGELPRAQVEVQLVVRNSERFEAARPRLLGGLEG